MPTGPEEGPWAAGCQNERKGAQTLLNFSILWSSLGDHSIPLHSLTFTNTVKCKIEVFKPDFLLAHNRRKQVVAFVPKDKTGGQMKTMGGGGWVVEAHTHVTVCSPLR